MSLPENSSFVHLNFFLQDRALLYICTCNRKKNILSRFTNLRIFEVLQLKFFIYISLKNTVSACKCFNE